MNTSPISIVAKNLLAGCVCINCRHLTMTRHTSSYGKVTTSQVCDNKIRCEEKGQGYAKYVSVVLDDRGTCEEWKPLK